MSSIMYWLMSKMPKSIRANYGRYMLRRIREKRAALAYPMLLEYLNKKR